MRATDSFANAQQTLQLSTLIRMNYLCKPIAGLLFITVNFFQDASVQVSATVPADVTLLNNSNNNEQLFINLATVPADGILLSRLRKAVTLAAIESKQTAMILNKLK